MKQEQKTQKMKRKINHQFCKCGMFCNFNPTSMNLTRHGAIGKGSGRGTILRLVGEFSGKGQVEMSVVLKGIKVFHVLIFGF